MPGSARPPSPDRAPRRKSGPPGRSSCRCPRRRAGRCRGRGSRPPRAVAPCARSFLLFLLRWLLLRKAALAPADRLEVAVVRAGATDWEAADVPGLDRGDDPFGLLPRGPEG